MLVLCRNLEHICIEGLDEDVGMSGLSVICHIGLPLENWVLRAPAVSFSSSFMPRKPLPCFKNKISVLTMISEYRPK